MSLTISWVLPTIGQCFPYRSDQRLPRHQGTTQLLRMTWAPVYFHISGRDLDFQHVCKHFFVDNTPTRGRSHRSGYIIYVCNGCFRHRNRTSKSSSGQCRKNANFVRYVLRNEVDCATLTGPYLCLSPQAVDPLGKVVSVVQNSWSSFGHLEIVWYAFIQASA